MRPDPKGRALFARAVVVPGATGRVPGSGEPDRERTSPTGRVNADRTPTARCIVSTSWPSMSVAR